MLYNAGMIMSMPRPAPDLDQRREEVIRIARAIAEADGWPAVTMRRLAHELGVTQPVLYTAFASRQALIDAVALVGFDDIAAALEAVEASPQARMRAYLNFAHTHPAIYEAMFSLPSELAFAADDTPEPLQRAYAALHEAFPDTDGTRAEVAWSALHGLATLQASGRLRASHVQARMNFLHRALTQQDTL